MESNSAVREWLDNLKVGDPVVVRWVKDDEPQIKRGIVNRLLVHKIVVRELVAPGEYGFGMTFKFRKSDGRRWPLNAYSFELWRIEKPGNGSVFDIRSGLSDRQGVKR